MRLDDVLDLFYSSTADDWHVIKPMGVNYTSNSYADGIIREHPHHAVYRPDASLTIAWGYTEDEPVAPGNVHLTVGEHAPEAMQTVRVEHADLFWHGALIERLEHVSVDRDPAASIPMPRRTSGRSVVTRRALAVAELLAELASADPLEVRTTASLVGVQVEG
ncbi:hypothetical protein M3694_01440 [Kocuria marina]|uniref:hypothetical protein n=1 Tax=Kocuria marina TaxID=223184 RepID=UPI002989A97E|nr:hypothetical protein [Kocuria marina]MCT2360431.1 hypothetical protein [Kocuria marina]